MFEMERVSAAARTKKRAGSPYHRALRLIYSDCGENGVGYENRLLNAQVQAIDKYEITQLIDAAGLIGEYNNFNPVTVQRVLRGLLMGDRIRKLAVGRADSPLVIVWPRREWNERTKKLQGKRAACNVVIKALQALKPDELSIEGEDKVDSRVVAWWD